MEEMLRAMQECLDKIAIQEVFSRYANAIDNGDAEGLTQIFHKDCAWKWETADFQIALRGKSDLRELAEIVAQTCPGAQHLIANHVITPQGDKAHAACQLMVFLSRPEGIYSAMQGFYDADLVKVKGEWLLLEMRVRVLNPEICLQGKLGEYWAGIGAYLQGKMLAPLSL